MKLLVLFLLITTACASTPPPPRNLERLRVDTRPDFACFVVPHPIGLPECFFVCVDETRMGMATIACPL